MQIDLVAVLPELILTVALCGILTIDLFLPQRRRWLAMPLSVAGVAATLAAVLNLTGSRHVTFGGMFVVDRFSVLFKVIFCVAALIVFLISHDYLKDDDIHQGEYYTLILSSLLGMLTIASSRDLILIFVALELISLPTFVLAGVRKSDVKSNEASLKFFLFGILSTTVMLFGMSLIYGLTGATNLTAISQALAAGSGLDQIAILSIFFIIVGFGFKVSMFPFQWWVPDTYEGSPVPVAAFLSVASKTAGFVGLFQVIFLAFGGLADVWRPFLAMLGVLTMTFGNLVALWQKHLIRLLAYSSIGQAGYILIPLGVASATNRELNNEVFFASVAYLLIYAFMETGAFAAAIAFGRKGGYLVSDYGGLFYRAPALALVMAIFLLSLAGMFPLAGWAAKFFVFKTLIEGQGLWLAVIMAINTVIALFYYAAVVRRMFFDQAEDSRAIKVPVPLAGALAATSGVVLVVGVLPDLFGQLARQSVPF